MVKRRIEAESNEEHPQIKKVTRATTMSVCKVCMEPVSHDFISEDVITLLCCECKLRFHGDCVGVASKFFYNLIQKNKRGWTCYTCHDNKMQFLTNIAESVKVIDKKSEKNAKQIDSLKSSVDQALVNMTAMIEETKAELLSKIEVASNCDIEQIIQRVGTSISQKTSSNSDSVDLSYVQSLERKNNLVIQNISVLSHESVENLKNVVVQIANLLLLQLDPNSIITVIRLRGKLESDNTRPLTNSILVKFSDMSTKDELFYKYILAVSKQNFINGSLLGLGSTQRIYINHHLTPQLSRIKSKATELKKGGKISKINARYDAVRVFVNDSWIRITDIDQLNNL